VERLAADPQQKFLAPACFSRASLLYMRAFAEARISACRRG
jgi:hypothetical protein